MRQKKALYQAKILNSFRACCISFRSQVMMVRKMRGSNIGDNDVNIRFNDFITPLKRSEVDGYQIQIRHLWDTIVLKHIAHARYGISRISVGI